jgi:hypothetical protein
MCAQGRTRSAFRPCKPATPRHLSRSSSAVIEFRVRLAPLAKSMARHGPSMRRPPDGWWWLAKGGQPARLCVHLDLDVLDPKAWPAVAVPEPDGLDIATLSMRSMLRDRAELVGVSITEYVPGLDHAPSSLWPVLDALGIPVRGRRDEEGWQE